MPHYMLDRSYADPAEPGGRAETSADIQASSDEEAGSEARLLAQTGAFDDLRCRVRWIDGGFSRTLLDWQADA